VGIVRNGIVSGFQILFFTLIPHFLPTNVN